MNRAVQHCLQIAILSLCACISMGCGAERQSEGRTVDLEPEIVAAIYSAVVSQATTDGVLANGAVCLAIRDSSTMMYGDVGDMVLAELLHGDVAGESLVPIGDCELQMRGSLVLGVYFPSQAKSAQHSSLLWLSDRYLASSSSGQIDAGIHVAPLSGAGYLVTFKRSLDTGEWIVTGVEKTWVS